MAIARFENLTINRVINTTDDYGQQTTSLNLWFKTRGRVQDVHNNTQITRDTRFYTDYVKITVNYTPNTKEIVDNQNLYAINWRNRDWRISDCFESNDRMNVTFMCYRNDPVVPV